MSDTINITDTEVQDFTCNILILGKTGVGKSSLLNYLAGKKLAEFDVGRPVTKEGIFDFDAKFSNNQKVRIFDSWGLEPDKLTRWESLIKVELEKRGIQKDMQDWFHAIVYCIQAGGHRVEDIDTKLIREFLESGYHVTVVLTKADQVDNADEEKLKNIVISDLKFSKKIKDFKIVGTCAEEKITRGGNIKPFGRDAVIEAILSGWRSTIMAKLPEHCMYLIKSEIEAWRAKLYSRLERKKISGLSEDNRGIEESIEDAAINFADKFDSIIAKKIEEVIKKCNVTNRALIKSFDIKIADPDIFKPAKASILKNALGFVFAPIVQIFKSLKKFFNRENEKSRLRAAINEQAERMFKELESQKTQVEKSIREALQV